MLRFEDPGREPSFDLPLSGAAPDVEADVTTKIDATKAIGLPGHRDALDDRLAADRPRLAVAGRLQGRDARVRRPRRDRPPVRRDRRQGRRRPLRLQGRRPRPGRVGPAARRRLAVHGVGRESSKAIMNASTFSDVMLVFDIPAERDRGHAPGRAARGAGPADDVRPRPRLRAASRARSPAAHSRRPPRRGNGRTSSVAATASRHRSSAIRAYPRGSCARHQIRSHGSRSRARPAGLPGGPAAPAGRPARRSRRRPRPDPRRARRPRDPDRHAGRSGGAGKSRLAIEAARARAPRFDGRIAWIPLASIAADDQVASELASGIGLADVPAERLPDEIATTLGAAPCARSSSTTPST